MVSSNEAMAEPMLIQQSSDHNAEAPETISIISLVMAAWRTRFMFRVSEEIKSPAFFEAASIAVIRAPCSEATDSRRLLFAQVTFLMNGPVRKQSCKSNQ